MTAVRRRLSWVVSLWLACQVAGVVAAPLAFCCQSVPAADDDEQCCPGLLPGQICPMHHRREGEPTCKMRDACAHADSALVSLAGIVGLLPPAPSAVNAFETGDRLTAIAESAIARAHRPESPPPRA